MLLDEGVGEEFFGAGASAGLLAEANLDEVFELGRGGSRRLRRRTRTDVINQTPKLQFRNIPAFIRLRIRKAA